MSENKLRRLRFNGQDLLDLLMPIGFQYEMYPVAHSNDPDVAFPPSERPAALWPGTEGELIDDDEGVFYRTEGGTEVFDEKKGEVVQIASANENRVDGKQRDQMQRITGRRGAFHHLGTGQIGEGAITTTNGQSLPRGGTSNYNHSDIVLDSADSPDARASSSTNGETRPTNRLFRIYRRTA